MDLFHYTKEESAFKIIESRSLRASRFDSLNDTQEVKHIDSFLEREIEAGVEIFFNNLPRKEKNRIKSVSKKQNVFRFSSYSAHRLLTVCRHVLFSERENRPAALDPFIISFCSHDEGAYEYNNGMLSQWRAYGRDGYCLVFDRQKMSHFLEMERDEFIYNFCEIADVCYGHDIYYFRKSHDFLIRAGVDAASRGIYNRDDEMFYLLQKFISEYVKCSVIFKHIGFIEERETRIILSPVGKELREIFEKNGEKIDRKEKEKISNAEGLPNIYLNFEEKFPLKKVIVGPGLDQDERLNKMKNLVAGSVPVIKSETPYIDRTTCRHR
ncbi:DUF2971 domain-containing protein [Niveispirillum sp. SYP-B3756]|uniref:DUF2971 domain-containing protein n=1 Tax=Niveispirillum sp. SYP-B3756 TaxID=2662178 RepID=UPI001290D6B2|nr:DUF2971 domain-containing protein [Niveispirillum sp. SYP-B3756]MQP64073.1 DUF2971 domain-containing protein [Niveispirillum sp. SYP-B3756]